MSKIIEILQGLSNNVESGIPIGEREFFINSLLETAEHCSYQILQVQNLLPLLGHTSLSEFWQQDYSIFLRDPAFRVPHLLYAADFFGSRKAAVEALVRQRSLPVHSRHDLNFYTNIENPITAGRLLVFNPTKTLWEGATMAETPYFGIGDEPAWDTWITYVQEPGSNKDWSEYLISWVPSEFISEVQDGINAMSTNGLSWLSDIDTEFSRFAIGLGLK